MATIPKRTAASRRSSIRSATHNTLVDLLAYARQRWRTRRHRRLFKDGALLWQQIARDKTAVLKALHERFPRAPRSYVEAYLESLVRDHAGNPKAPLYLDAELGAW